MFDPVKLHYEVDGADFTSAGEASEAVKRSLKQIGIDPAIIRKVVIAMYEGEINMVIHANGGVADVEIYPEYVEIVLTDEGKGIEDVELAMQAGFTTAPDSVRTLGFGAGMGLPNMKKYTDVLKIDSEVGKGTRVFMRVNIK